MEKKQSKIQIERVDSDESLEMEQIDSGTPAGLLGQALKTAQIIAVNTTGVTISSDAREMDEQQKNEYAERLLRIERGINAIPNRPRQKTGGSKVNKAVREFALRRYRFYLSNGATKTKATKKADWDTMEYHPDFEGVSRRTYDNWDKKYPV